MHDVENSYWAAYWDLSTERQEGGPIPWTAVCKYADREGFRDEQILRRIVRSMDSVYLKHRAEKQKRAFDKDAMRGR